MIVDKRCKLCKIGLADPNLLNKIHNKRLRDADPLPLRMLTDEISEIIATSDNEAIKSLEKISFVSVQNHFSKHVSLSNKVKYKAQNITKATQNTRKSLEVPVEVSVELAKIDKERVNLYEDLTDLYLLMKNRFDDFDNTYGAIILGQQGEKGTLEAYSMLSKELRACLGELNKMKQSEQVTKNVLHFALKHYTKVIIEEALREVENLRHLLAPHVKDAHYLEDIINTVQHNFGTYITKGASDTLQKTNHQFNLN